jgi:acyl carrier protein
MDGAAPVGDVRVIVTEIIGPSRLPPDVGADTPLGEGGLWLDSLEMLQLILACEVRFEITFRPAEDLVGDSLRTLGTLAALIRRRARASVAGGSPPAASS